MQLIDGTMFAQRMGKSLNNKRHEITPGQIAQLTRIYGNYLDGETASVVMDKKTSARETRIVSRIFDNHEFGFLKTVVERPLRLNFRASPERIARLDSLDVNNHAVWDMRAVLEAMDPARFYRDLAEFDADLQDAATTLDVKLAKTTRATIWKTIGDKDPEAEPCYFSKRTNTTRPEPDPDLRDTENVPLPAGTQLPLPMPFGPDPKNKTNGDLVTLMTPAIDAYMAAEVLPHVLDAWVDYDL